MPAKKLKRENFRKLEHREWQRRKYLLRHKGRPRVRYGERKASWQPHKRHISERPRIVAKRRRIGDWEADLVHGSQDDSRHCILTMNERLSGYCVARKITELDSTSVARYLIQALRPFPVRTITCDNGSEFGRHKVIERALRCRVYFTDPNSPQQRGSNENLNGLLREFFPKGKSLVNVHQADVSEAMTLLNHRPRKRFGYRSPEYVLNVLTGKPRYYRYKDSY